MTDLNELKKLAEAATPGEWVAAANPQTVLALIARLERAEKALEQATRIIGTVADDDDCWYDHHGYCQAHHLQPKGECVVELARAWLKEQR